MKQSGVYGCTQDTVKVMDLSTFKFSVLSAKTHCKLIAQTVKGLKENEQTSESLMLKDVSLDSCVLVMPDIDKPQSYFLAVIEKKYVNTEANAKTG